MKRNKKGAKRKKMENQEERRRRIKIVCDECIEIEKNHGTALALEHARLAGGI